MWPELLHGYETVIVYIFKRRGKLLFVFNSCVLYVCVYRGWHHTWLLLSGWEPQVFMFEHQIFPSPKSYLSKPGGLAQWSRAVTRQGHWEDSFPPKGRLWEEGVCTQWLILAKKMWLLWLCSFKSSCQHWLGNYSYLCSVFSNVLCSFMVSLKLSKNLWNATDEECQSPAV